MIAKLLGLMRRALAALVLAFLVYAFVQTLPIDIAILLAGDTLVYFEIVSAVWLTAQATRIRSAFAYARIVLRLHRRRIGRRARRLARAAGRLGGGGRGGDEEGGWATLVPA